MTVTDHGLSATRPRPQGGGPAPYGWAWAGRGQLVPVPVEQHIRWLILHLADQGLSLRAIAAQLRDLHVLNRDGQNWHYLAVRRVIAANGPPPG